MSADATRRSSARHGGQVVRPQAYNERSVVENVVGFIQDVVPQAAAYTGGNVNRDDRDQVLWIKFEQSDMNDPSSNPDLADVPSVPPLLLIIGYSTGAQIWSIPASGEAQELVSWQEGSISHVTMLPQPESVFDSVDAFSSQRPLVALTDTTSSKSVVSIVSLRTAETVKQFSYVGPVDSVQANRRVVVVGLSSRLEIFDACSLKIRFTVNDCFVSAAPCRNPFTLGRRLLAYCSKQLYPLHQSGGGMSGDGGQSYAATVLSAAKSLTEGLTWFGGSVVSSVTGSRPSAQPITTEGGGTNAGRPGVVTVIDVQGVRDTQFTLSEDHSGEGVAYHFPAHANEAVVSMKFDAGASLLVTADRLGHNFHVFKLIGHPWSSARAAVHHLYTLYRGDTTALVQNISITRDSRWVAVSTVRGTTHVFPITPYGGAVCVRTHCSPKVVNRSSRFHKSADIDEMRQQAKGPSNLSNNGNDVSFAARDHCRSPRDPPFPHPVTVTPLEQIKQTFQLPGVGVPPSGRPRLVASGTVSDQPACVAACFGVPRGWLASSQRDRYEQQRERERRDQRANHQALFVAWWAGGVVEYSLDPRPRLSHPGERVSDGTPLQLVVSPRAHWPLQRARDSGEVVPPLPSVSPLLRAAQAVATQRPSDGGDEFNVTRQESRESLSSEHSSQGGGLDIEDQWLAQVEIVTHAGPGRRLWMGPQFTFKPYQSSSNTTVINASSPALLSSTSSSSSGGHRPSSAAEQMLDLASLSLVPGRSSPQPLPPHSGDAQTRRRHASGGDLMGSRTIEAGSFGESPLMELYPVYPGGRGLGEGGAESASSSTSDIQRNLEDAMIDEQHDRGPAAPRDRMDSESDSSSGSRAYDARWSPTPSLDHVIVQPHSPFSSSPAS